MVTQLLVKQVFFQGSSVFSSILYPKTHAFVVVAGVLPAGALG